MWGEEEPSVRQMLFADNAALVVNSSEKMQVSEYGESVLKEAES